MNEVFLFYSGWMRGEVKGAVHAWACLPALGRMLFKRTVLMAALKSSYLPNGPLPLMERKYCLSAVGAGGQPGFWTCSWVCYCCFDSAWCSLIWLMVTACSGLSSISRVSINEVDLKKPASNWQIVISSITTRQISSSYVWMWERLKMITLLLNTTATTSTIALILMGPLVRDFFGLVHS